MRQRKSNHDNHRRTIVDEESGESSSDDEEEVMIQAVHPTATTATTDYTDEAGFWPVALLCSKLFQNSAPRWWVHTGIIAVAAVLTYSYNNNNNNNNSSESNQVNVQIAIMTVIVLAGAISTLLQPSHLIAAATGAFVGGQAIIGSNTKMLPPPPPPRDNTGNSNSDEDPLELLTNYLWLLLLSLVVGLIWSFVMVPHKLLDGYAGRLGTTTFLGMNAVMLVIWGPTNVVHWNRYYYGFVAHTHLHVGEEDAIRQTWKSTWAQEAELAIGYVLAVVWLGAVGGWIRIRHHCYIQQWHQKEQEGHDKDDNKKPTALNNVIFPCVLALLSMLLVNATQYRHQYGLYNGFAVGSYVAMAALPKISTTLQFSAVSLLAAAWGLFLTPFFVGFAGKSGFTSMMGHVTYVVCEQTWHKLRQQQQQEQQQQSQRLLQRQLSPAEEPIHSVDEPSQQQQQQQDFLLPPTVVPPSIAMDKSFKPRHDTTFLTKQQRRQRQRLQHQRTSSSLMGEESSSPRQQEEGTPPTLIHRGWQGGDGVWQHPLNHHPADTHTEDNSSGAAMT